MTPPNMTPQPDGSFPHRSGSLLPPEESPSAQFYLKQGKTLYQSYLARARKQDLETAIQCFQKAVEMEPALAEAYVQLASALWDQGAINLELAQFYCETALKLDPRQSDAHLYLGYFLQQAGFLDDAIRQYAQAIRKNIVKSGRPRIALAHALFKQSSQLSDKSLHLMVTLQGLAQFITGLMLLPLDPAACLVLKEAFISDIQVYTFCALAKVSRFCQLTGLVSYIYKAGIQTMPKEPLFYHLLGDLYLYDLDKPHEAIAYYQKIQALEPQNITLIKKLAKAYLDSNDHIQAAALYAEVVESDGRDFDAYYQLGQIHTEEKAYTKALYYFKEAEKHQPLAPYVHSNMAYVLFKMNDMDGAFAEYQIALEYGTDPIWLSTVAQTIATMNYQIYGDTAQAIEYFQHAIQYHPENIEAMGALGDLYFETGQLEHALNAYRTVLNFAPESADCYSNIGYILWQLDMNEAAIDAYTTAIHYDRHNVIAQNNLGVIHLDEYQNAQHALPLFQSAFSLKADYTLACFNVGRALEALGRNMEAAEAYSTALKINQLNPELEDAEIQAHLDRLFN